MVTEDADAGLIEELEAIFHPESVAVVGAPRGLKAGKVFLMGLLDQGYAGTIYPINPVAEEIDGIKAYPNLTAVPGPVDLAIVLVTADKAVEVVRQCADKRVKAAVLFSSGFKELGTEEGRRLEEALVREARAAGVRLIGPNCMGLYSPLSGLSFFPELATEPGPVGMISHSGSLTNILGRTAPKRGLCFSKVVSLGNECDLHSADFLLYLGRDESTKVIGAYLEGIKDGPYFVRALKDASRRKPVVVWKVGMTDEGGRAAASHTGALAGSPETWAGVANQTGAAVVRGFEAFSDALLGFAFLESIPLGNRIAVVSGPGGLAVSAAEACGIEGLKLAEITENTRQTLARFVPPTGTSLNNPIDVGLTASFDVEIFEKAARAAAEDPNVDGVFVVGAGISDETNRAYVDAMIRVKAATEKPLVLVSIPGFDPGNVKDLGKAAIPFFDTPERAVSVYAMVRRYQTWRRTRA